MLTRININELLKIKIQKIFRNIILPLLIIVCLMYSHCYFEDIQQPTEAQPNDTITVKLTICEEFAETTNAHKGIVGILMPIDWSFLSGNYEYEVDNGLMLESPAWTDSLEFYYPADQYDESMKWICLISDTGYTYSNTPSAEVTLHLQTGSLEGCFKLAYLTTKATKDLLGTGNTAFSYPNFIGIPDSTVCDWDDTSDYESERTIEWESMFNRTSGWTGADGIYSIPLSGNEIYSTENPGSTLFLFSDTFIGDVNDAGIRENHSLVNNTMALLDGNQPVEENIEFTWGMSNEEPVAVFVPDTPESQEGDWYWLMDGIALDDTIYVYGLRLRHNDIGGAWGWDIVGISLISFRLEDGLNPVDVIQMDTPLLYNGADGSQIVIGQAIMSLTTESGNPNTDGYIYVNGVRSGFNGKEMVSSRVLPGNISNFSEYHFWNGTEWVSDIQKCAAITNQISMEYSLTPLASDKYIAAFQLNTMSRSVAIRFGDSPVGPFDPYEIIWDCPENDEYQNVFTYNAKAHPHLSEPGKLLISYNVNSFGWDSFTYGDIYRPRFVTLDLTEIENDIDIQDDDDNKLGQFTLNQNFPNPFNNSTSIGYTITKPGEVNLSIYDLSGRMVRNLLSDYRRPGKYLLKWKGMDNHGRVLACGLYIYQLRIKAEDGVYWQKNRKMIYLK